VRRGRALWAGPRHSGNDDPRCRRQDRPAGRERRRGWQIADGFTVSALVTGGANGVGAATARRFCEEGAKVAFVDRDLAVGRALEARLVEAGLAARLLGGDVSLAEDVARVVAEATDWLGRIDILYNQAGIIIVKPFLEISLAEWDEPMDNNAKSALLVTRAALPEMLERGHGILIFTSTTGVPAATHRESAYCASKAAMHQVARSITVGYRDRGIRANTICPSFIRTRHGMDEIEQLRALGVPASEQDVNIMQGRTCEPEEVALFLATDASSFVIGAEIFADNTFTAV
jgi:NAD(P)-dependent dehydrogenase (short-subunit alcohol dehydrogenase family)